MLFITKDIAETLGYTERQIRGWINNNCDTKLRQFNKDYFDEKRDPISEASISVDEIKKLIRFMMEKCISR